MKRHCTASPNVGHETQSCCEKHDADYTAGSGVSRSDADLRLLICVASSRMPWRAMLMFVFVRAFGWMFYGRGK